MGPAEYEGVNLTPAEIFHETGEDSYTRLDDFFSQLEQTANSHNSTPSKLNSEQHFPEGFTVNGRIYRCARSLMDEIIIIPQGEKEAEPHICKSTGDLRKIIGQSEIKDVKFFYGTQL